MFPAFLIDLHFFLPTARLSLPKQNSDSEPPLPSNYEQPIPTSANASPPNEFVINKIEPPREKYLY